jgi:DNA replication protein DnaC
LEEQITTINNYDEIQLTDEETAEALRAGREKKALDIAKKEYWNKITAEPIIYKYTAEALHGALENSITANGKKYVIDKDNEYQVEQLCYYFAGDARFNGNLSRGIMLMGGLGVGKSHLMSFFFQNQVRCYRMASCRQIEGRWNSGEPELIEFYSRELGVAVNSNKFGHNQIGFCFDDLGVETVPSKRFGEEKNVMAEIIMARYENGVPYGFTHITTNLTADKITALYGDRVRDRLKEMCNLITFSSTAKSRR